MFNLESWRAGELESWRAGELESWRAGELETIGRTRTERFRPYNPPWGQEKAIRRAGHAPLPA